MISHSRDGEAIFQVLRYFGFQAARGSSTRGGIGALKQMMRLLQEQQSVAITPDGPQGPPYRVQSGIILLAKKNTNTHFALAL